MISIFTTTKQFLGEINVIQKNAIGSWKNLRPECEIILFDNEEGAEEVAKEFKLVHIKETRKNKYGTPLINDIFEKAQKIAKNRILAYVNADIILMNDFLEAVFKINLDKFLMVGRRYDIDIKEKIDYNDSGWERKIKEKIGKEGVLKGPAAIDYFIFPRHIWREIPPFAVGRTLWDNWLLYKAWISNIPLIDATGTITIVHQNHKFYIPKNQKIDVWKGPEAKINQKLAGGISHALTIRDASKILTKEGIKNPKTNLYRIFSFPFRYFEKVPIFLKIFLFPGWLTFILWRKIKISKV